MPGRLLTRDRLAALVAALVLAVWVAALLAGPAAATTPTTLTASLAPTVVTYHESAVVSGTVMSGASPVPHAALALLARPAGAADFTPAASTTAGADGAFRFAVAPSVTTDYRVVFAAATEQSAGQADVTLHVRPRITMSSRQSLWLGGRVILRGEVSPARPGGAVTILRRVDGAWGPFLTATLDADSRFALRWTPQAFGGYRLRALVDADAGHDGSASAPKSVIVNRPNAHRVPLKYAHYIVIVRHEYRLYYYEHGVLVRRFDVALGRPGYRTPLGSYRVYGKRKPAGGALGACAMYYRPQGAIAIHGTNQPYLIRQAPPRDFSHGCARMRNRQALWLYQRVPVGTPVHNLR